MATDADIAALLYLSDEAVARYLYVTPERVAKVRAKPDTGRKRRLNGFAPNGAPRRIDTDAKSAGGGEQSAAERAAADGSARLLRRQLETGQCIFTREAARAALTARGWI